MLAKDAWALQGGWGWSTWLKERKVFSGVRPASFHSFCSTLLSLPVCAGQKLSQSAVSLSPILPVSTVIFGCSSSSGCLLTPKVAEVTAGRISAVSISQYERKKKDQVSEDLSSLCVKCTCARCKAEFVLNALIHGHCAKCSAGSDAVSCGWRSVELSYKQR